MPMVVVANLSLTEARIVDQDVEAADLVFDTFNQQLSIEMGEVFCEYL